MLQQAKWWGTAEGAVQCDIGVHQDLGLQWRPFGFRLPGCRLLCCDTAIKPHRGVPHVCDVCKACARWGGFHLCGGEWSMLEQSAQRHQRQAALYICASCMRLQAPFISSSSALPAHPSTERYGAAGLATYWPAGGVPAPPLRQRAAVRREVGRRQGRPRRSLRPPATQIAGFDTAKQLSRPKLTPNVLDQRQGHEQAQEQPAGPPHLPNNMHRVGSRGKEEQASCLLADGGLAGAELVAVCPAQLTKARRHS